MAAKHKAQQLIDKYLRGECTDEEKTLVERFYLQQLQEGVLPEIDTQRNIKADMWAYIQTNRRKPAHRLRRWMPYAAAAVLAVAIGWFFGIDRPPVVAEQVADITPGGNRATLTLADGRIIALSETQSGVIVGDGVAYLDGSTVLGEQASPLTSSQVYTLTTPKGGTYRVTLPDGSNVWLNSASDLKYPSRFSPEERVVELTGEAYFEVEKDGKRPFKVKSPGQQIEVLGTSFNITAYREEEVTRTALITGSVKITNSAGESLVLLPSEEAQLQSSGALSKQSVDIEGAVAWKNGYFVFNNESIYSILRKISRWYDVEIQYEGDVGKLSFLGIIPRSENISVVLNRLAKTGDVTFKIDGRRVIVMR